MWLKHVVNRENREYFIEKVNLPLVLKMILLAGRYPEPTHENVLHPNSHILLNIRDEFREHWAGLRRVALYEALFKVLIVKYEHSPPWRNMLDWFFMMIEKSNWKPFNLNRQMVGWKE